MSPPAGVLALDVGNSKTDAALVSRDGRVLAGCRGPSGSHQASGTAGAMRVIKGLAAALAVEAGMGDAVDRRPLASVASCCFAGADTPGDRRLLGRELGRLGLAERILLRNDTDAPLRAGSERGWGVALVCGAGINALGVGPSGRTARFAALGSISGDWGGGDAVGSAALAAAVRGRDGRGPRTSLERKVPAHFGVSRPIDVTLRLYDGRLDEDRLGELAPVVMTAATEGDAAAVAILERLGDELGAWAVAAIRRAGLARIDPDVVLSGGVMRARDPHVLGRLRSVVAAVAPRARVVVLDCPPVVGAALLGLDALASDGRTERHAEDLLRAGLTEERLARKDCRPASSTSSPAPARAV